MIFRFRVCENNEAVDSAQGWVSSSSELEARNLVGPHAYLQAMPHIVIDEFPNESVIMTLS